MSSKFIHRLKKRLLIPTLTMLVIVSQIAPLTAQAATNEDIMDLINSSGVEMSIVLDEDAVAAPINTNRGKHTSSNDNVTVNSNSGVTSNKKSGYSSDGREFKSSWTNVQYKTARYWSEQNPELKEALDSYFSEKNLFNTGDINGKGERASLWRTITYKDSVYKALKSKTQRSELAKIAVDNGLIAKESYASAPYIALFEYYGIINRDDGLLEYSNSSKVYLSREQATLMIGRFVHPDSYFSRAMEDNNNDVYSAYVDHYDSSMLIGSGKKAVTNKELASSMSRLEFIYLLTDSYFPDDVEYAKGYRDGSDKDVAKIFKDIDTEDYATSTWAKKVGIYGKGKNEGGRATLKYKKLDEEIDAHIQAAYNLGILKKDAKGNANLFKNITYSEAVRMLINAGLSLPDGKAK